DEWPKGCKFAPRCEKAWEKCRQAEPELLEIAPGHRVRCFLHESGEEDKG
ncbi:MAG: oligopeptide/dipeptide ABC transporter ATP-binding protein, partial [Planifilum fimeticola]